MQKLLLYKLLIIFFLSSTWSLAQDVTIDATVNSCVTLTMDGIVTIPSGVDLTIDVEAWGAGGGSRTALNHRSGGGGGAYFSETDLVVSGCATFPITVGQGAVNADGGDTSYDFGGGPVIVGGGQLGNVNTGGSGGTGPGGAGSVNGGDGGDREDVVGQIPAAGGGGGGSGPTNGPGSIGGSPIAGIGGAGGTGGGGDGGDIAQLGMDGAIPGGGGGGKGSSTGTMQESGAAGGRGQVIICVTQVTPNVPMCDATEVCDGFGGITIQVYDPATCSCVPQIVTPPTCDPTEICDGLGNISIQVYDPTTCGCIPLTVTPPTCDPTEVCDGLGNITTQVYDPTTCGCIPQIVTPPTCDPTEVCDGLGNITTQVYDPTTCGCIPQTVTPPTCDPTEVCDGLGDVSIQVYDPTTCGCIPQTVTPPTCDPTEVCDGLGDISIQVYDPTTCGCIPQTVTPPTCDPTEVCDGLGNISIQVYDPTTCGCIPQIVTPPVCDPTEICDGLGGISIQIFDPTTCGCVPQIVTPPVCDPTEVCDGLGNITIQVYDPITCGCIPQIVTPPTCDPTEVCDGLGNITIQVYDPITCGCIPQTVTPPVCDPTEICDGLGGISIQIFDPTTCGCVPQIVTPPVCDPTEVCDGLGNITIQVYDPITCGCIPQIVTPPTCDATEVCDGLGNITIQVYDPITCGCISQVVTPPVCDPTEVCDGLGNITIQVYDPATCGCIPQIVTPPTCDPTEICDGLGNITIQVYDPATCGCIPQIITPPTCDPTEICDGLGNITIQAYDPTTCGCIPQIVAPPICDPTEVCDGLGNITTQVFDPTTCGCIPQFVTPPTCDPTEACDGLGNITIQAFDPTTCGCIPIIVAPPTCDPTEVCDGLGNITTQVFDPITCGCIPHAVAPPTCDPTEICDGLGNITTQVFDPTTCGCIPQFVAPPTCDPTEVCDGLGNTTIQVFDPTTCGCIPIIVAPPTCDPTEVCDGLGNITIQVFDPTTCGCVPQFVAPPTCDPTEVCDGLGNITTQVFDPTTCGCVPQFVAPPTCDPTEVCDGLGNITIQVFDPTTCGCVPQFVTPPTCDPTEVCDGLGNITTQVFDPTTCGCVPQFVAPPTCDPTEVCDGLGNITTQVFDPTTCGCIPQFVTPPTCDPTEACDGLGNITIQAFDPTTCGCIPIIVAPPTCDPTEVCDGLGNITTQVFDPATCGCIPQTVTPPTCDPTEVCDGLGNITTQIFDPATCGCVPQIVTPPTCDPTEVCDGLGNITTQVFDPLTCGCVVQPVTPPICNTTPVCDGMGNITYEQYNPANCACELINDPSLLPDLSVINPAPVCTGSTVDITIGVVTDNNNVNNPTITYWNDLGATTPYSGNPVAVATTSTIYVQYDIGGCIDIAQVDVTVNNEPDVMLSFSSTSVCSGEDVLITFTGTPGAEILFNPLLGNTTVTLDASGMATYTVTAGMNNFDIILVSASLNGCSQNYNAPYNIMVASNPNAMISGPVTACEGDNITFTFTGTENGNVIYNDGNINQSILLDGAGNGTVSVPVGSNSITYTLVSIDIAGACLTNIMGSAIVSVTAEPPAPGVVSPVNYCLNQTAVTLTATTNVGGDLVWYDMDPSAGGVTPLATAPTPNTTMSGSTTYYVSEILGTCEGPASAIVVNVSDLPTIMATGINPTACGIDNGSIDLTFTDVPDGTYTISFDGGVWPGVMVTGNTASISPLPAGAYENIIITVGSCSSVIGESISLSAPSQPSPPMANAGGPYCTGDVIPDINATGETGADFSWYNMDPSMDGASEIDMDDTYSPLGSTETVYVTQTVMGCESGATAVTITVNPFPEITPLGNDPTTCGGNNGSIDLDFIDVPDGTYTIDYDGGIWNIMITAGMGTINGLPAGDYNNIQITVGGCTSATGINESLSDPANPSMPTTNVAGPYCAGTTVPDITASGEASATFTWYDMDPTMAGAMVIDIDATYTPTGITETVYVTQTLNGCESLATPVTITVEACTCPDPVVVEAGMLNPICSGDEIDLTSLGADIMGGGGVGGNWSSIGDGIFDDFVFGTATTYTLGSADISNGTVTLTLTSDLPNDPLCMQEMDDVVITITATPQAPIVSSPVNYCVGDMASVLVATANSGGILTWYDNDPTMGGLDLMGAPTPSTASPTTIDYYVTETVNGCEGTAAVIIVNINNCSCPNPIIVEAGMNQEVCEGDVIDLTGLGASITGDVTNGEWSTNGNGSFNNTIFSTATIYTLGSTDISNGTVTLTLTSDIPNDPLCMQEMDDVVFTIIAIAQNTETLTETICTGDFFTINGVDYNTTGQHTETITNGSQGGCDSIIVLNLTVEDTVTETLTETICSGDVFTINGVDYNTTGQHSETITNGSQSGCDSIIVLNLTVENAVTETLTETICTGDFFTINGVDYNITGQHTETITNGSQGGCDSIIVLNLTVEDAVTETLTETICTGDFFTINGVDYNTAGQHTETITNGSQGGCDSIIVLNLTVEDAATETLTESICSGEVFTINGVDYNTTGQHTETITNGSQAACDSIIILNLTVEDAVTQTLTETICTGDFFTINGVDYNTTGQHSETITNGSQSGCDSIIVLNLTVENAVTETLTETICTGDFFTINGVDYNTTGQHSETITNGSQGGCDSIIVLNLTVEDAVTETLTETICTGDFFTINGIDHNTTGQHSETITNGSQSGCDSIIVLNLTVEDAVTETLTETICTGDFFTINGVDYNTTGQHSETITNGSQGGCDSIIVLNLTVEDAVMETLTETICTGDSFTINGVDYNTTGQHSETITNGSQGGCDSIIVLNLTVEDAVTETLTESICSGEVFTINGVDYNTTGQHSETITNGSQGGCDSIIVLNLTVEDAVTETLNETICTGDFFTINGVDYNTTGQHSETITNGSQGGCDSIIVLNLTVEDAVTETLTETICSGDFFTINGVDYNTTGQHSETITNGSQGGCDSIIVLNLTVEDAVTETLTETICTGDFFTINGVDYNTTGQHTETITNGSQSGCDSIIILNLTVEDAVTQTLTETICTGDFFTINGVDYNTTGQHTETITNGSQGGCDSIIVLNLTVENAVTETLTETICTGDFFTINGVDYNTTGQHSETITNGSQGGCDSIIVLNLTVEDAVTQTLTETICTGDFFTINGVDYNTTGQHSETITNGSQGGCDSIIVLNLTVEDAVTETLTESICSGEVFTINGVDYNTTGQHSETITNGSQGGCDSIIVLNLTVEDAVTETLTESICSGEVFTINGVDYNTTGQHTETITNGSQGGCDSIIVLNLTVEDAVTQTLTETICTGDFFTINGVDYNTTGQHTETITNGSQGGCDSIIVLNLTVEDAVTETLTETICSGDVFTINGVDYNTTGQHSETITNGSQGGCDSIIVLNLTVEDAVTETLTETICTGDFFTINGVDYNTTGQHSETITNGSQNGCDSIIVLNLTVEDAVTETLTETICTGDFFTINGVDYNTTGQHSETITNGSQGGCDSIIVLNLTVEDAVTETLTETICTGDFFTINGVDYNTTGQHSETITNGSQGGCDSTIVLNLTVEDAVTETLTETICSGNVFTINGVDYNTTGQHTETITNGSQGGCDSIIVLNLTVEDAVTETLTETICIGDFFTINDVDYNTTGQHTETITNGSQGGCDSIIVLNLTVEDAVTETLTETICTGDFFTINGVDYNTTGQHSETITNGSQGCCDSIIVLNLTVEDAVTETLTESICSGEIFTINGVDYNTTGQHSETITNGSQGGCDSIIVLNLTVEDAVTQTLTETICTGDFFTINGVDYNTTGQHSETISNGSQGGCDSIIVLNLTVEDAVTETLTESICSGEVFTINGVDYNTTGQHTETITNGSQGGCDSIIVLNLTVEDAVTETLTESICSGEVFTINGVDYNTTGQHTETITNGSQGGCDSIIVLNLTVEDAVTETLTESICSGEVFTINGVDYNTTGQHTETITNGSQAGCDSIIVLNLTVEDAVTQTLTETICTGDFFTINGVDYNTTGQHTETINNGSQAGCDSIIVLNLTVEDAVTETLTESICSGDVFTINGVDYNTTGQHSETITNGSQAGCDSIIVLNLTVEDAVTESLTESICSDDVFTINGVDYNTTGQHIETITNGSQAGCDSVIVLNLTVNELDIDMSIAQQISCNGVCDGALAVSVVNATGTITYDWDFDVFDGIEDPTAVCEGTYVLTITDGNNCTATETITLLENDPLTVTINPDPVSFCEESSEVLTATAVGGEGTYSYQWTSPTLTPGNIIEATTEMTYTVEVMDENGCIATASVTPSILTATADAGETMILSCDEPSVTLMGDGIDVATYTWTGPDPNMDVNAQNPSVAVNGIYTLVVTNSEGCTASDNVLVITDDLVPLIEAAPDQMITCDDMEVELNASSSITGGVYTWTFPDGTISNSQNPMTTQTGTFQVFVTDTMNNCNSPIETFTVIDSTDALVAVIVSDPLANTIDCTVESIDLIATAGSSSGTTVIYEWEEPEGQLPIVGPTININTPGDYILTVIDTLTGCLDTDIFNLSEDIAYPPINIEEPQEINCVVQEVMVDALASSSGINILHQWGALVGIDTIPIVGENSLTLEVTTAGTYCLTSVDTTNGCSNAFCIDVLQDISFPIAEAGATVALDCTTEDVTLDGSANILNAQYDWTADGLTIIGETLATPLVNTSGTYYLTITNPENQCTSTDSVMVIDPNLPVPNAITTDPLCYGEDDGSIIVDQVIGGIPPYNYSIDGGETFYTFNTFGNLNAGIYDLVIQDVNGCESGVLTTQIVEPPQLNLTIDSPYEIHLGDSVQFEAQINIPLAAVDTIIWFPADSLSCVDCLDPWVDHTMSTNYSIQVIDTSGCEATERVQLIVDRQLYVFIPTVFSPNGDGSNDVFTIFAGEGVEEIKLLQIFDRWGGHIFESRNFQPNDLSLGWDGTFKGKVLNPAVFVYYVEILMEDGRTEIVKGDITILR